MNTIQWKIGEKYLVDDIMSQREATLEGFIINQIPVGWKDVSSYSNHNDSQVWFVLSFERDSKKRYVLSKPSIKSNIHHVMHNAEPCSWINLYGHEYGDSPDELIKKLKKNWVFTNELSYEATYQEGFKNKEQT